MAKTNGVTVDNAMHKVSRILSIRFFIFSCLRFSASNKTIFLFQYNVQDQAEVTKQRNPRNDTDSNQSRRSCGFGYVSGACGDGCLRRRFHTGVLLADPPVAVFADEGGQTVCAFIAFVGMTRCVIVLTSPAALVTLGNLAQPASLLSVAGIFLIGGLLALNVPGAMIIGILVVTLAGIALGVTQLPEGQVFSFSLPLPTETFLQMDQSLPKGWRTRARSSGESDL